MRQIDLREGARRQHRAAAVFSVIQCWLRGLDGVILERSDLERVLGLERFKKKRVSWLREDFKEFFPFQQVYWVVGRSGQLKSFSCLWVSRRDIRPYLPEYPRSSDVRLKKLNARDDAPRMAKFKMWPKPSSTEIQRAFSAAVPFFADSVNFDERFLASYLSLLCGGQISPRSLPSLQEPARLTILGVHAVPADHPCHLVEILVEGPGYELDFGEITQEMEGLPRDKWMLPWHEQKVEEKNGRSRHAFFFHYLDLHKPFLTPLGSAPLPPPTKIPVHLKNINYEAPGQPRGTSVTHVT